MTPDFSPLIAQKLNLAPHQVSQTIALLDDANTIPFIARYRKEVTGNLDEEQLRQIRDLLDFWRKLHDRKQTILNTIEEQGKLTPKLRAKIEAAETLTELEDLYLPYKPKRRTKATIARERGLAPLADTLLTAQDQAADPLTLAADYLNEEVPTAEDALAGARDIIAETVAEHADTRASIREFTNTTAFLAVKATKEAPEKDPRKVYEMYYQYREALQNIPPHRLLAINRAEREGVLSVKLEVDSDHVEHKIESTFITHRRGSFAEQLRQAIADAYKRLLGPSIEREVRNLHSDQADQHAIENFSLNLRNLLLQAPIKGHTVIGLDPGYRTGCKVAVVSETGKFLGGATIYPHPPQKQWSAAKDALLKLMSDTGADIIAIGNGTASRETETLAAETIRQAGQGVYVMVNEAGASVYSASKLAREEFPDVDVSLRGAISIARRLQDPLAELVKIDPKAIGVGLYQHDVDQKNLGQALDEVVESVVNTVGVDLNTASPALLRYVSGLNSRVATNIVKQRDQSGPFRSREQLLAVKGLGAKTYQQAAGFLKIPDGKRVLDNTFIHPESYDVVLGLLGYLGLDQNDPRLPQEIAHTAKQSEAQLAELAEMFEVGLPTLKDILANLAKPGRDVRDDLPPPLLRADVLTLSDLREEMVLKGTVRNVVDFGAFVDIGVKQDGLVHISEMANRFIKSPHEVVSVGDVIQVRVLSVDEQRGRIALSMKL